MATLAVLLVPLALLQAASGIVIPKDKNYTSPGLTIAVVDNINDAARYYNNQFRQAPPVVIPDVHGSDVTNESRIEYTFSEGTVWSKGIKVLAAEANVSLDVGVRLPVGVVHILTALFPITVKDFQLHYDRVESIIIAEDRDFHREHRPQALPSPGLATVIIGKNKVLLEVLMVHGNFRGEKEGPLCYATVLVVKVEQFEPKSVVVLGKDKLVTDIVKLLADDLKKKLADGSYARQVIETVLEQRVAVLFPFCHYLPPFQFQKHVRG